MYKPGGFNSQHFSITRHTTFQAGKYAMLKSWAAGGKKNTAKSNARKKPPMPTPYHPKIYKQRRAIIKYAVDVTDVTSFRHVDLHARRH